MKDKIIFSILFLFLLTTSFVIVKTSTNEGYYLQDYNANLLKEKYSKINLQNKSKSTASFICGSPEEQQWASNITQFFLQNILRPCECVSLGYECTELDGTHRLKILTIRGCIGCVYYPPNTINE
jgi:hypothetical protein